MLMIFQLYNYIYHIYPFYIHVYIHLIIYMLNVHLISSVYRGFPS